VSANVNDELRSAAVSIPIVTQLDRYSLLLTQRPRSLRTHAGEVCFPGGAIDASDASPLAAAIRELHEEIGIPEHHILSYREETHSRTTSGYRVQPFIMLLRREAQLKTNRAEVAAYHFLSLSDALELANYRIEKFSTTRDDFDYSLPTPLGPVRGMSCALLVQLVKQISRYGSFEDYACTFATYAPT